MGIELLIKAANLYNTGDKRAAEDLLLQLVKEEPFNADAWYGLALCAALKQNQIDRLEYCLLINPEHTKAQKMLAKIQEQQAEYLRTNPRPAVPTWESGINSRGINNLNSTEANPTFCPKCGHHLRKEDAFCTNCGSIIKKLDNNKDQPILVVTEINSSNKNPQQSLGKIPSSIEKPSAVETKSGSRKNNTERTGEPSHKVEVEEDEYFKYYGQDNVKKDKENIGKSNAKSSDPFENYAILVQQSPKVIEGITGVASNQSHAETKMDTRNEKDSLSLDELVLELDSLVGLSRVKGDIKSLLQFVKIQELRRQKNISVSKPSLHTVFYGSPGTGKTTVARMYGQMLAALGLLSKGHLVETDRSGLIGGYIGQTEIKTDEKINEALGGILFIDEAYSLSKRDDSNQDYGEEAISILSFTQ